METRAFVFICILFAVFVVNRVSSQVGELCRPNERFLSCGGCQKTCKDPAPSCAGVCRVGCYCDDDEVRNETGHCVKLADCPPLPLAYKEETIEPHRAAACPPNEEYRFCEPCNKTCDNPNPICPAQCARGCFCKDNLLRDLDGKCVEYKKCSNLSQKTMKNESTNYINLMLPPLPYELICGQRQVYNACGTCEKTCSNPKPQCTTQCIRGCFCQHGLVRAPSGDCVELEKCPKAEVSLDSHEPSVEDCAPDEEYLSCGWCEPSCSQPVPQCPLWICTRGCMCRPGLLRHHSGHCVDKDHCVPQKCPDQNEEFVCRYGCEPRCDWRPCYKRPRRCTLGCHCKLGLYRDGATGKCIILEKCSNFSKTFPEYYTALLPTIMPLQIFNATDFIII